MKLVLVLASLFFIVWSLCGLRVWGLAGDMRKFVQKLSNDELTAKDALQRLGNTVEKVEGEAEAVEQSMRSSKGVLGGLFDWMIK